MSRTLDNYFMGHPKPLFSLSWVELWERFSFYGIRPLLILFMIATVNDGGLGLDRAAASSVVGIFAGFLYLAALPGGWLADNWLGQKNATFIGALSIAIGHLLIGLSVFYTFLFFLGLVFIVLGTGLFKTCASVMVGMLYKDGDTRRDSGFTIFYMGINLGAFVAPLVCGLMQKEYGWHWGFGIGGVGMLISLVIFYFKTIPDFNEFSEKVGMDQSWEGPVNKRKGVGLGVGIVLGILAVFLILCMSGAITLNPVGIAKNMISLIVGGSVAYFLYLFFFSGLNPGEKKNLIVFLILFVASAFFWSTFEQQPTSFNLFAEDYTDRLIFGWEIPTAWFQSVNALFIILLAPAVGAFWVFLAKANHELSSVTKFALGMIGAGLSFAVMMIASYIVLDSGGTDRVSPLWLIVSFLFLTLGELALSPVGLSIMTQIAPKVIRGQVMGLWFVSLSLGNVVAGLIGGGVEADNLEALPDLFGQQMWVLFGIAIVLLLIRKPIENMLKSQ